MEYLKAKYVFYLMEIIFRIQRKDKKTVFRFKENNNDFHAFGKIPFLFAYQQVNNCFEYFALSSSFN